MSENTINNFFTPPPERKDNSSCHSINWLCIQAHTILQQLQYLTSDDKIHSHQTCLLLEFFPKNWCLNRCFVC